VLAEQRGVEVALTTNRESGDHRSLVRVRLTLTNGTKVEVAGTSTGPRNIGKLVELDGYDIDVAISDHLAFLRYHDKPGVVGVVGRVLGEAGVNIANMQVARNDSGHALIVLTLDQPAPSATLEAIVKEIDAHSGRAVSLI
jgi:D-3-phosphoglycerate dehydrogenase